MKEIKETGITLIALVITIIVMLILVAVTVNIAINGGLFNYAKIGSEGTKNELAREQGYTTVAANLTTNELIAKFTSEKLVTIYGDADCNGIVENRDATTIMQYVEGNATITEQGLINADVNLDGIVDNADAQIVMDYKNGSISELPQRSN